MENIVGQVVPQGIQPPGGVIQGMGHPCKRVPVGAIESGKCPPEKSCVKRMYMRVLVYIDVVIPENEFIMKTGEID